VSTSTGTVKNYQVGRDAFGNSDDAKSTTTSAVGRAANHLVDFVLGRVNCARESIAAFAVTLDLYAPIWHLISEWCCGFQVYRVPTKLEERLTIFIDVGPCYVRSPIANRAILHTPDAGFFTSSSRWVDVVAGEPLESVMQGVFKAELTELPCHTNSLFPEQLILPSPPHVWG
jgi:hypothetical protein